MLKTLTKKYPSTKQLELDEDYPERTFWYELYSRVYDGKCYEHLKYAFTEETSTTSGYDFDSRARTTIDSQATTRIGLSKRRPSVRVNLAKVVVNDSTSMLFDDAHFPSIKTDDEKVTQYVEDIYKNTKFKEVMLQAAIIGSLGSVAVQLCVLKNKLYFTAFKTEYLTPEYDLEEPDVLTKITEKYKITAEQVKELGYKVDDKKGGDYWFCREWTATEEIYYVPWNVAEEKQAIQDGKTFVIRRDESKTVAHDFGFVPFVWIKNLPKLDTQDVDGECTFKDIIDNIIEIDYQLSQLGRGLKYNAEPLLLIKTNAMPGGNIDKSKGNALCLDAESDAKMLEINGDSVDAAIKYVEELRKLSLEVVGANRADPEKIRNAQSGKALEMLNQSLVWLVGKLRVTYGEGVKCLLMMSMLATTKYKVIIGDNTYKGIEAPKNLPLIWPPYFSPTSTDKQADATTLIGLTGSGLMSKETAVTNLAANYDAIEPDDELALIKSEQKENDARESQKMKEQSNFSNAQKNNPKDN